MIQAENGRSKGIKIDGLLSDLDVNRIEMDGSDESRRSFEPIKTNRLLSPEYVLGDHLLSVQKTVQFKLKRPITAFLILFIWGPSGSRLAILLNVQVYLLG